MDLFHLLIQLKHYYIELIQLNKYIKKKIKIMEVN